MRKRRRIFTSKLTGMNQKSLFLLIAVSCASVVLANPPADEGRAIFTSRCAGCHTVNKDLTGPALAGVDQRRSMDWIVKFVHSSQTVIRGGDRDAIALFEKFNRIPMPDHSDLTEQNIAAVVEYIKSQEKTAEAAPFKKPAKLRPAILPIAITNYGFFAIYLALVFLLAGALVALVRVKEMQRRSGN